MKRHGLLFICLTAMAVASLAPPATSQEITTGTIAGVVTDDRGRPIADAVVTAQSPQGARRAISDKNGYFIIPFLTPGNYTLQIIAAGFSTIVQDNIIIKLNEKTTVKYAMQPGKVETITVTGQAPLLDRTSTSIGTNVKVSDFTASIPIARNYSNLFLTAPGVVSGGGTGAGNFSIGGSSGLENSYLIDGINITNTGYGGIGAYNIVYGSLGTGVTGDFLDEVQVKTGGFEAEFGQALGGVLNAIVKSGTNEFRGGVAFNSTFHELEGSRERVRTLLGSVNTREEDIYDFAFSYGGPFVKDKLFWFVAINPVETKTRFDVQSISFPVGCPPSNTPADCTIDITTNPDIAGQEAFPASQLGLQERVRRSYNYAGKLTWFVAANHRFDLSFFGDPSRGFNGPQNADTQQISGSSSLLYSDYVLGGGQSGIRYGANNGALKYNGILTPKFFIDAQISRHHGRFSETPLLDDYQIADLRAQLLANSGQVEVGPVNFRGGPGFLSDQRDLSTQYSVKLTNVIGKHEVRYGAGFDDIEYTDNQHYSGPSFTAFVAASCTANPAVACVRNSDCPVGDTCDKSVWNKTPIQSFSGALIEERDSNQFEVIRSRFRPVVPPTTNKVLNLFAQDTWQITSRWTVKAGVRATHEKVKGSGNFTLPYNLANPGRVGTTTFLPSGYTFDWEYSPRIGAIYDVLGNGKSKLYGNYARYYEQIPNDLAVRSFSNEVGGRIEYDGPDPRTATQTDTVHGLGGATTTVQPGTRLPYEDEYILGYQQQIRPDLAVEIRGIFRYQGRVLEDTQFSTIEATENYYYGTNYGYPCDPFPSSGTTCPGVPAGSFDAAPFGNYVLANPAVNTPRAANFPAPKRDYKALEFNINKTFSNSWAVTANYRYAQLKGNYEGLFRNDNGQSDPNITSLFDFPNSPLMSGQFASGFLNTDRTHVLNVYPYYRWPSGFTIGGGFNWQSGTPRTPQLAHPHALYQNSGELPGLEPVYAWWLDSDGDDTADTLDRGKSSEFFALPKCSSSLVPGCTKSNLFLVDYKHVPRGLLGRNPDIVTIDVHFGYPVKFGEKSQLNLSFDVFNVFNNQEARRFDDNVESTAGVGNPDFLTPSAYGAPRAIRLAANWTF
ncbi:MAG TPA: TonB-dependent receptor [Candidatus Polarisedimenticolia bacterium]|nr:TonB-dependent receptor [Candidatus Polarisedimenticolia bacterium]